MGKIQKYRLEIAKRAEEKHPKYKQPLQHIAFREGGEFCKELVIPTREEFIVARIERAKGMKNQNSYECGWQDCYEWLMLRIEKEVEDTLEYRSENAFLIPNS